MITVQKIKQVRKQLRSGIPEGEIKNEMLAQGYTEEDLGKVFVAYRPDMRGWFLFFAIVFSLIGIYQVMVNTGILFLLFAAGMFSAYYFEKKRIKKTANK